MGGNSSDAADSDEIEERPWRQLLRHTGAGGEEPGPPQITVRAVFTGVTIGTILCVCARSNSSIFHAFLPLLIRIFLLCILCFVEYRIHVSKPVMSVSRQFR